MREFTRSALWTTFILTIILAGEFGVFYWTAWALDHQQVISNFLMPFK